MVLLSSLHSPTDFLCPDFRLPSVDDKVYGLQDFADSCGLLVLFMCNHCPYVKAIEDRIIALRRRYNLSELAMVAICSNDAGNYPADSKSELLKRWREKNYGFPYLLDESQDVAKAFAAVCTPDLFLFDRERKIFYHGRLDDNWQNEMEVKNHDLANAIDDLLVQKTKPASQHPSMGCSIKWLT